MENKEKSPMVFVDGMIYKEVPPTAPEAVRGEILFKYPDFARFIEQNRNEKGWMSVKMMKQVDENRKVIPDGKVYFILNTWKPTPTPEQQQETKDYNDNKYKISENPIAGIDFQEIPF